MTPLKLSICIPTYNRAAHLRRCFEWLEQDCKFDFRYEIVVADNHSTDDTQQIVQAAIDRGMPVRYFKAYENTGMIPNVVGSFRLGRGEYLLYLADDDRLIGSRVAEIVKYLDDNQGPNVCYAPMYIYDDATDTNLRKFSDADTDETFKQGAYASVFNFMIRTHAFPENGIYRSEALRACWVPREGAFFAFSILAHFLDTGDVVFMAEPFYRQTTNTTIARDRQQGGHELAETAWDLYLGGLEYFIYVATKRNAIGDDPEQRKIIEQMCKSFTVQRMAVAFKFLLQRHEYIKAYEVYTRLMYSGIATNLSMSFEEGIKVLPIGTALQTLAFQLNFAAGVNRLILSGFNETALLRHRLVQVKLKPHIDIVDYPTPVVPERLDTTAVLVALADQRQYFLDLGYPPNLVFSQQDLTQAIVM